MSRPSRTALPALAALLLVGCSSSDPTAPGPPPLNEGFVPLAVGSVWTFDVTQTRTSTGNPPTIDVGTAESRIVGTETIGDFTYSLEERAYHSALSTVTLWKRHRQDENGLYAADVPESSPPPGNEPTLLLQELPVYLDGVGERIELQYPLEEGRSWDVSATERAVVEGVETVEAAGLSLETYRVRIDQIIPGAIAYTRLWYSTCGLVRFKSHREFQVVIGSTGQTILVTIERLEELTAIDTAADGCAEPTAAGG